MTNDVPGGGPSLADADTRMGTDTRNKARLPRGGTDVRRRRRRGDITTPHSRRSTDISPVWEVMRGVQGMPEASEEAVVLRRDAVFRRGLAAVDVLSASLALLFALYV